MNILYVFTSGRRVRLQARESGEDIPLEFLFGMPYLHQRGYAVDILELSDLHPDTHSSEYQNLHAVNQSIHSRFGFTASSHLFVGSIEQLNHYDVLVAGNENVAFGLAHFKQQRILKPRLMFFVMGMLAYIPLLKTKKYPRFKGYKKLYKYVYNRLYNPLYQQGKDIYRDLLLSSQDVIFLGKGEYEYASKTFRRLQHRFHFLPFAVDTDFWIPAKYVADASPNVLFMGNDGRRDFQLVLKIAQKLRKIHFTCITSVIKEEDISENVDLIAGNWKQMLLSDVEIREHLQRCSLVILPLKETFQPSGQSVALQAMACGKPVLITKTSGFWEPGTFVDQKHLWFIHSDRVDEWCEMIERLLGDPGTLGALGHNARNLVEKNNHLEQFGQRLEHILTQLSISL